MENARGPGGESQQQVAEDAPGGETESTGDAGADGSVALLPIGRGLPPLVRRAQEVRATLTLMLLRPGTAPRRGRPYTRPNPSEVTDLTAALVAALPSGWPVFEAGRDYVAVVLEGTSRRAALRTASHVASCGAPTFTWVASRFPRDARSARGLVQVAARRLDGAARANAVRDAAETTEATDGAAPNDTISVPRVVGTPEADAPAGESAEAPAAEDSADEASTADPAAERVGAREDAAMAAADSRTVGEDVVAGSFAAGIADAEAEAAEAALHTGSSAVTGADSAPSLPATVPIEDAGTTDASTAIPVMAAGDATATGLSPGAAWRDDSTTVARPVARETTPVAPESSTTARPTAAGGRTVSGNRQSRPVSGAAEAEGDEDASPLERHTGKLWAIAGALVIVAGALFFAGRTGHLGSSFPGLGGNTGRSGSTPGLSGSALGGGTSGAGSSGRGTLAGLVPAVPGAPGSQPGTAAAAAQLPGSSAGLPAGGSGGGSSTGAGGGSGGGSGSGGSSSTGGSASAPSGSSGGSSAPVSSGGGGGGGGGTSSSSGGGSPSSGGGSTTASNPPPPTCPLGETLLGGLCTVISPVTSSLPTIPGL